MAFPGFDQVYVDCPSGARVFTYRKAGTDAKLPVLVLIHGYPQNSLKYKEFVKEIPSEYTILVPDLPGYGNSTKPIDPADNSRGHSKREWAKDIVHVVDTLFSTEQTFIAYGHDRGARISYRLALDFPSRVVGAGFLDIVPIVYMWDAMRLERGHAETKKSHHWIFLSSPRPYPETLIGSNPRFVYEYCFKSWAGSGRGDPSEEWVKDGVNPFLDPVKGKDRIAAACEDYRAGASHDIDDDFESSINPLQPRSADAPPVFTCPLLILSSHHLRKRFDVDGIWKSLGVPGKVQSYQIGDETTGHFLVNEKQEETGKRTREWLAENFGK